MEPRLERPDIAGVLDRIITGLQSFPERTIRVRPTRISFEQARPLIAKDGALLLRWWILGPAGFPVQVRRAFLRKIQRPCSRCEGTPLSGRLSCAIESTSLDRSADLQLFIRMGNGPFCTVSIPTLRDLATEGELQQLADDLLDLLGDFPDAQRGMVLENMKTVRETRERNARLAAEQLAKDAAEEQKRADKLRDRLRRVDCATLDEWQQFCGTAGMQSATSGYGSYQDAKALLDRRPPRAEKRGATSKVKAKGPTK